MNSIKKITLGLVFCCSFTASAGFIASDLEYSYSDGTEVTAVGGVIHDDNTGLEWLKITLSSSSFSDSLDFWDDYGFRFSTNDDVTGLLNNIGLPIIGNNRSYTGDLTLADIDVDENLFLFSGLNRTFDFATQYNAAFESAQIRLRDTKYDVNQNKAVIPESGVAGFNVLLVRTYVENRNNQPVPEVPEPSSLVLMLTMLGLTIRKFKNRI